MNRKECLEKATECVCGKRDIDYGRAEDSFASIAGLWAAYRGVAFTPKDVAVMMMLLKIARIKGNQATEDSFVDIAGYSACGCEIATGEKGNSKIA